MNLEEYKDRIDKAHTVTGFPSYWEQLQEMTAERDMWRELASGIASVAGHREYCNQISEEDQDNWDCNCGVNDWDAKYDEYAESKGYRSPLCWSEEGPERSKYKRFRRRTVIKLDNEQCQELSEEN